MNAKHLYTADEKLSWWGYGEWVEEVDEMRFDHKGVPCLIMRMMSPDATRPDGKQYVFGGHLCGYCALPDDHPWQNKGYDVDADVHGGVTFNDEMDGVKFVGFDCAHLRDLIPSMKGSMAEVNMRISERMGIQMESFPHLFQQTYRNIEFVKNECMKLAEQMLEASVV